MSINIREGFERINAAWWGFLAAIGLFSLGVAVMKQTGEAAVMGLGMLAFAFVGHRVCRWIIRGFFPAPSP